MKKINNTDMQQEEASAPISIEIHATFVADPVLSTLHDWFSHFHYAAEFAPVQYGQVLQRLLSQDEQRHSADIHVILFAVRDLVPESGRKELSAQTVHPNIDQFISALESAVLASSGTWIVVRCPDAPTDVASVSDRFNEQSEKIAACAKQLARTVYIDADNLADQYELSSYYDEITDRHAHIPYTQSYYSALGTLIFRVIRERLGQVYKLIVLDCDDTLWEGVCGEVAVDELVVQAHHQWLHQFVLSKMATGTLLALCSQNNSIDVCNVFEHRQDLGLRLTDFSRYKINWHEKPDNIRELAEELNIALESIIFIDNDPLQRNKVKTALPEVLVPELPASPEKWPFYLQHVWAFDNYWVTDEASQRQKYYQQHAERENVRTSAANLQQFIEQLALKVSVDPATEKDVPRLFELLHRVTQFNFNGLRHDESVIKQQLSSERDEWLAVRVEDKFGDYGLVGALCCHYQQDSCLISTFLLSCRALGRTVEHSMLQAISERAQNKGIHQLKFRIAVTDRNAPALFFLKQLGMTASDQQAGAFKINVNQVAQKLQAIRQASLEAGPDTRSLNSVVVKTLATAMSSNQGNETDLILEAAQQSLQIDELAARNPANDDQFQSKIKNEAVVPRTETEEKMLTIFKELLGHENVSLDDEFFDVGGHSLLVMRLLSRVSAAFGVDLPMRSLFVENLTIANLAAIVESSTTPEENNVELDAIKNTLDSFSDDEIAGLFGDLAQDDKKGR